MADRLADMSLFIAAIDAGSLSAAARSLGLPLATVSRRVAELEIALGARLLTRSARGLALTDTGVDYLAACRRILEDVAEAERVAAGEFTAPRGVLTLTAPLVFGRVHVLPVVADFLKTYPDVEVRLEQTDRLVGLQEEKIDAAIRIGHLPDSSLRARRLGTIRRVVCASPDYLATRGRPERPEDVADHDAIEFVSLMQADRWRFGEGASESRVRVRPRLSANTAEAAIAAAKEGLGLAPVLSYQIAEAVAEGRLEIVLAAFEPAPWPVHLVYKEGLVPQKLRAFVDFAGPRLEARLRAAPVT